MAKLDATTSYPFLLNVLVNQVEYQIDESQIDQVIRMVINLFIRRNFVLTPKASNLRSAFNGMRKDITDNKFRGENLVSYIARKINVIMPSNQQFENALNEGIYDKNVHTTRFLLISLERKFGNYFHNGNPDSLDDYKGNKLRWSIEHILPQGNLPKYWVDIIGDGNESVAEENQRKNVHRLGNLTLTPYNSGLGQKTFQEKLLYKDPSNDAKVGLTLPLFLNDSIQKNVKEFNIESIEQRNNELIQKVLEIVPSKIEAN
ncbi:HNH endonuclease family protein [Weissella cibaria]|uniref:HNH endonuclease family protein n=1 Tax=Weissella cibaria TaxID=137591 RepID=UPI00215A7FBF|nr:HNH endonuclease family protein [Weissella cibaria]MCR8702744.1 HNH endonuclease family protein [Weissella cibaria]